VLLFCPERLFLQARTVRNNRRIQRFFGREGHDWDRIDSFKLGLAERLAAEHGNINTLEIWSDSSPCAPTNCKSLRPGRCTSKTPARTWSHSSANWLAASTGGNGS
jgi:hypothetical protein